MGTFGVTAATAPGSLEHVTVLVTGAGGPTGQGVVRALQRLPHPPRIVCSDLSPLAAGLFWADAAYVLPRCSEVPAFVAGLYALCQREGVSVVIPGSDLEARVLVRSQQWQPHPVVVGAAPVRVWRVTGDKLATHTLARQLGIATPASLAYSRAAAAHIGATYGYPVIIKPRRSSGSRGIHLITRKSLLPNVLPPRQYIVQRYLNPEECEFTVGAYFNRGCTGVPNAVVAMRRTLYHGNTLTAEFISPAPFEPSLRELGTALGLEGYCNFQFIAAEGEHHLIDINARFSSSVSASLAVGCNFPGLFLNDFVLGVRESGFRSEAGVTVVRHLADEVVTRGHRASVIRLDHRRETK